MWPNIHSLSEANLNFHPVLNHSYESRSLHIEIKDCYKLFQPLLEWIVLSNEFGTHWG